MSQQFRQNELPVCHNNRQACAASCPPLPAGSSRPSARPDEEGNGHACHYQGSAACCLPWEVWHRSRHQQERFTSAPSQLPSLSSLHGKAGMSWQQQFSSHMFITVPPSLPSPAWAGRECLSQPLLGIAALTLFSDSIITWVGYRNDGEYGYMYRQVYARLVLYCRRLEVLHLGLSSE